MQKTRKNAELVTDRAKVTGCDGLHRFNWRSLFKGVHTQQPVTIRHPSLIAENRQNPSASTCASNAPDATTTEPARAPRRPSAARLRLANEIGGIVQTLAGAKRLKNGDWRINGEIYDHDNAVLLAAQTRGTTTNGYPLTFDVRAAYEPVAAAAYAHEMYRRDEISAEQRDNLLRYAHEAADNAKADITQNENGGEL
jgi:hypothetical protein